MAGKKSVLHKRVISSFLDM